MCRSIMKDRQRDRSVIAFLTLGELGALGANPFRAGEVTLAKGKRPKG
jgi:hypothetical protein